MSLEVGPGFLGCWFVAPVLASIIIQASLKDQVVSVGEDLLVHGWLLAGGGKGVGIFNLFV